MPTANGQNGTDHSWDSLPNAMSQAVSSLSKLLNNDKQWQAFIDTKAIIEPVTIAIQSSGSDDAILVKVEPGSKTTASTGSSSDADFTLRAHGEQWDKFFAAAPVRQTYSHPFGFCGGCFVDPVKGVLPAIARDPGTFTLFKGLRMRKTHN